MQLTPSALSLLLFLPAITLDAQPSLDHARHARALLGPETWSQLIRVENVAPRSPYPRTVYALVFELAGILWFYTDADGTQSFSLHRDNLAAEKSDFGPLLRDIEKGFARWTVLIEPPDVTEADDRPPLRNGCFIESVVALRERLARGAPTEEPRLLSYYANAPSGLSGHTVLTYAVGGRLEIFDPAQRDRRFTVEGTIGLDPLALAQAVAGRTVNSARYLALPSSTPAARIAMGAKTEPAFPAPHSNEDATPM